MGFAPAEGSALTRSHIPKPCPLNKLARLLLKTPTPQTPRPAKHLATTRACCRPRDPLSLPHSSPVLQSASTHTTPLPPGPWKSLDPDLPHPRHSRRTDFPTQPHPRTYKSRLDLVFSTPSSWNTSFLRTQCRTNYSTAVLRDNIEPETLPLVGSFEIATSVQLHNRQSPVLPSRKTFVCRDFLNILSPPLRKNKHTNSNSILLYY